MTQTPTLEGRSGPTIFVDAEPFSWKWFAGVPRYTARLVMALAKHCPIRFFDQDQEVAIPSGMSFDPTQDLEVWSRRIWRSERSSLPQNRESFVGLYPGFRSATRRFGFEIGVLYDLCPLLVGSTFPDDARHGFQQYFSQSIMSSDAMIAISHSTKADAAWLCPMPPDRIHVAHCGPSLCLADHHHTAPVARSRNIGLVVSTVEPRKNAPFLIDWFHNTKVLPPETELWWVGKLGWLTSAEKLESMSSTSDGRRVRFLGNVSDARLCELYQTAAWSIYASLYEGFGFPVLDSLMHGTPVMTSYNSSLREFDHPGVWFFDPADPQTVDEAWVALKASGGEIVPRALLEELYDWDRVARLVRTMAIEKSNRQRVHGAESPRPHLSHRTN